MTTTQNTHLRPFNTEHTPLYNSLVTDDPDGLGYKIDRALRALIKATPGKKIPAIITFRDLMAVGGVHVNLREAKETIDHMEGRIVNELHATLWAGMRLGNVDQVVAAEKRLRDMGWRK